MPLDFLGEGIKEDLKAIKQKLQIDSKDTFNHAYYQGLIASIGNLRGFETFVPSQDKNKAFLHTHLGVIASLDSLFFRL